MMENQYVNLTPQQKMAQMLQQQQPLQLQPDHAQMMGQQAPQNQLGGAADAMKMYGQMAQQKGMQDYQDYMGRLKLGQSATGGMFDSANGGSAPVTANDYTG